MGRAGRWIAPCGLVTALLSCGCGSGSADHSVGVSTGRPAPVPIELELRTPDGVFVHVGDLRGRVTALFFFATFDTLSQAALQPISRFARHYPDVHIVGVALQPDAAALVDAWAHALSPPFVVTYDPNETVLEGTSDLGDIEAVPTIVFLDADGFEAERYVGLASERRLAHMLERTRARLPAAATGTGSGTGTGVSPRR